MRISNRTWIVLGMVSVLASYTAFGKEEPKLTKKQAKAWVKENNPDGNLRVRKNRIEKKGETGQWEVCKKCEAIAGGMGNKPDAQSGSQDKEAGSKAGKANE